jgi:UDP-N-acetylmuramoylalanine--D-glutamate ligase
LARLLSFACLWIQRELVKAFGRPLREISSPFDVERLESQVELDKKRIVVVGLGRSGLSATRWLTARGGEVTVSELRQETEIDRRALDEIRALGARLEVGGHRKRTFLDADLIVLSPGVPHDIDPVKAARRANIPVTGEMELAANSIDVPIVAVTGTNGKSTTTAFIGAMFQNAGLRAFVGGNIGTPLIDYAAGDRGADLAVVEVSSFQLDTMETFRPGVALLLNISPDHLDRYPSYEDYVGSKLKIFQNQDAGHVAILNDDDERLSCFRPQRTGTVLRYGLAERAGRQAFIQGRQLKASLPGRETYPFDLTRFKLPGRFNLENLMGAVLVGLACDLAPEAIQTTIDSFTGLPNRLERVADVAGIEFYNDSKATNVYAASRSVASFEQPLILIAGGRDKGGSYHPLVEAAKGRVRRGILLGEAKNLLASAFEAQIPFAFAKDMEDAVSQAFSAAVAGDVVLLAPACASFDMFSDYAQRGAAFRAAVERLGHGS